LVFAVDTDDLAADETGGVLRIDVDAGEPVGKFFFPLMVVRASDKSVKAAGCLRRASREPVDTGRKSPSPEGFLLRTVVEFLGAFFAGAKKSESLSTPSSFSDITGRFRFAAVLTGLLVVSNEEEEDANPTLLSFTDLAGAATLV
jgi:hypothetical protein